MTEGKRSVDMPVSAVPGRNTRHGHMERYKPRRRANREVAPVLREFQPHALAIEETPPSPFTRILLWSLATLLVAILLWTWVSRIPIMTTAPGKFVTDAHTKIVQTLDVGTVQKILVKPGEKISKGAAIVVLDPTKNHAKLISSSRSLALNHLEERRVIDELGVHQSDGAPLSGATKRMVLLEHRLGEAQLEDYQEKIEIDRTQVTEAKANLKAGLAKLVEYKSRAAADESLAKSAAPLVSEGALSGEHYDQMKDQAVQDQGELDSERQQVLQLGAAVISAQRQLDKDRKKFEAERYQDLETAVEKSYGLSSKYARDNRDYEMDWLRAPTSGTVQSVEVGSIGTVVQAGQTIATIVPSDAPLIVDVDLPAQDVGFVKVGQKTQIKVTAYPFEQYGSIQGRVIWISPNAGPTDNLSSLPSGENHQPESPAQHGANDKSGTDRTKPTQPPTLYYRVKVQPDVTWLLVDGQRRAMRPGMTASVDIRTGQRRVLDFFLDPIIKYVHNGLGVR